MHSHLLHIIPARGGSKRIPRKNLAPCGGKPLIYWTIKAAHSAKNGDVVISTEDMEIADYAMSMGCQVLERQPELATDNATGTDVALHAAQWATEHGYTHITYLQPTSPLRSVEDIIRGVEMLSASDAVVAYTARPFWPVDFADSRICYHGIKLEHTLCGAFFGARASRLIAQRSWYGPRTRGLYVKPENALDIDTPWDLHVADLELGGGRHA